MIAVKAALPHGSFLPWIEAEFGMSEASALRFMQVANTLGFRSVTVTDLPPSVLYALAAPSTSEPVREEVMRRAGGPVTHTTNPYIPRRVKCSPGGSPADRNRHSAEDGDHARSR